MTRTRPTLLLTGAIALALAGCAGLPDQRLARQALDTGDSATAERHFRQLADLGYGDANIGLADIQAASGDPRQLQEAERRYRQEAGQSPRAQARLGRLLANQPQSGPEQRREAAGYLESALAAGEPSALLPLVLLYLNHPQDWPGVNPQQRIDGWRAQGYPQADLAQILLYRAQGSYAEHLAEVERICKRDLARMDVCYVELASVYQLRGQDEARQALLERLRGAYRSGAVSAGRVESVAQVLADATLGTPDETTARELLEQIAPNHPPAWVSLARLLYDYPTLGDSEQMFAYLERGRETAQPRAELLLGRLYYEGKWVAQDPNLAETHLLKASTSETSAHYFLGQLYRRGYLGQVYPQKAVDHLLHAARNGQASADFALAQLYSQGRGIKVDPVNAYVFGNLALREENPQARELLASVETQLSAEDRSRAQRILQRERQLRGPAWQNAAQTGLAAIEQDNAPL